MAGRYKPGDTVYIVSSVNWIKEAKVLKYSGGFYTIKFTDTGGGIKLRGSRLFPTEEEAKRTTKGAAINAKRSIFNSDSGEGFLQ